MGGRREEAIALYEQYLARGDGARKADAEAALKELRAPEATGDEDKDNATAKGIFNKGGALYEKGDYGHAYDEFTRASELADRPGILFSRAQALRRLGGREAEAMALYQQYIDLGEGSRLEDAKQMLELLQSHGAAPGSQTTSAHSVEQQNAAISPSTAEEQAGAPQSDPRTPRLLRRCPAAPHSRSTPCSS